MKTKYDKHTVSRTFEPGEKVLALLPIPGRPLQARYFGPCIVDKKVSDLNYILLTPDRRKQKQLCHVNMLKPYYDRNSTSDVVHNVTAVNCVKTDPDPVKVDTNCKCDVDIQCGTVLLKNSDVLNNLDAVTPYRTATTRPQEPAAEL